MTTRTAVIGTGAIATQHLGCLATLEGVEVVAVCDLSPATAEAVADRWGAAAWFTDHRALLEAVEPDVVHVTTPPSHHLPIALDALSAGAHVVVEKPAAPTLEEVDQLLAAAAAADRQVIEVYTYLFSEQVQRLLALLASGDAGEVLHVDVVLALGALESGSPFADPNLPHPALGLPGGFVSDFLSHLASLAHGLVGAQRSVATAWDRRASPGIDADDELRALIVAERGTATVAFTAAGRPEGLWLRVETTELRAVANLFETRLTVDRLRSGPRPLVSLANGLGEGAGASSHAVRTLARKLSGGPGSYEGLWTLVERAHAGFSGAAPPAMSAEDVRAVNHLVAELTAPERRL